MSPQPMLDKDQTLGFKPGDVLEIDPGAGVDTVWPINNSRLKGAVRIGENVTVTKVTNRSQYGAKDVQLKFAEKGGRDYPADLFRKRQSPQNANTP